MKELPDRLALASYIENISPDINELNSNLAVYCQTFDTRKTCEEELTKFATECNESKIDLVEDFTGIKCSSEEEAIETYYQCKVNASPNLQLTMQGIQSAWLDSSINQGSPNLIVTRIDQANPFDDSVPHGPINLTQVNESQLREKIEYANRINRNSTSLLVIADGSHWAMLAIDPSNKKYRYIDSFKTKLDESMPPSLKEKLTKILPSDYEEIVIKDFLEPQQTDTTSCGYYVLKNAQSIRQNGIYSSLDYDNDKNIRQREIDNFALKVQKILINKTIKKLAEVTLLSFLKNRRKSPSLVYDINEYNSNPLDVKTIQPRSKNLRQWIIA